MIFFEDVLVILMLLNLLTRLCSHVRSRSVFSANVVYFFVTEAVVVLVRAIYTGSVDVFVVSRTVVFKIIIMSLVISYTNFRVTTLKITLN